LPEILYRKKINELKDAQSPATANFGNIILLPDSDIFRGRDGSLLPKFLMQMRLTLRHNRHQFPYSQVAIAYVVSRLSGMAWDKVKGNIELGSGVFRGFKGLDDIFEGVGEGV